ncbi:MAG TPA: Ig-like domain-containing protein [Streptosporangiaceae bacterium]|nr:Ig-like domain-containing protein [Streptosporangiaceae bacterium]
MRESVHTRAGRRDLPSRRIRLGVIAVSGAAALLAAACSSAAAGNQTAGQHAHSAASPSVSPPAQVTITPANGATHVNPSHGISVTVTQGKISNVTVTTGRDAVAGVLGSGAQTWQTKWPLHPSTRYHVTVTAVNTSGKTVTTTSSFHTLTPSAIMSATTALGNQTYGVGMPIMITFSSPVTRRAAVEKAIEIKSSRPVVGAWMWDGNQALDFRTQVYWPQHTNVSFVAHFNGLEFAPGVYGTANLSQGFHIGNSLIGVTSTRTHKTRIYWKNKLYGVWPDSSGMPGDDTADGTYLTIEKGNPVLMSGQGYKNVPVYWSVRFTWSGNYYHAAPWSLSQQGFINVSHGCVNLSPANAQTYYNWAVPGDPITITGSPSTGIWDDGYTEWFYSWNQLLKHSATHMAVQAGPAGSTLVNPATLPAAPTGALYAPKPGNYLGGR